MSKETFTTPKCVVEWAHLQQPQAAQGKFKETYKITVVLDAKDEAHKALLSQIKKLGLEKNKGLKTGDKGYPIKYHVDEDDNRTGLFTVTFKSQYGAIKTFDAQANIILRDQNFIANGSVCKVSWSYGFYEDGVSMYLMAVQVIDLIEWQGGSAEDYGFGEEEGHVESADDIKDAFDGDPQPDETDNGEPNEAQKAMDEQDESEKLPF
ncbi:MAG: hypothetical protein GY804_02460 [Alphaproteobacteria bacterium]|nr:hypothetical protein [Alphaproteobacteria bacterium]